MQITSSFAPVKPVKWQENKNKNHKPEKDVFVGFFFLESNLVVFSAASC